jgi:hypothetical protein
MEIEWGRISTDQKTFALEKYKSEIDYCVANMGKSCKKLELERIGQDYFYCHEVGFVTNGLIGWKYRNYRDFKKSAAYFNKDWSEYKRCEKQQKENKNPEKKKGCWPGSIGEQGFPVLIIASLEFGGLYPDSLEYYS